MLSFFPEMYPDELLYSVFARYHKFSGNQNMQLSYSDLLGCKHKVPCNPVVLPRNLEYLTAQIQKLSISYHDLLYERTFFPFLTFFKSDQQLKLTEAWAFSISFNGSNMNLSTHDCLNAYTGPMKYCPICLEEEYTVYGEAYWHRQHQIPGVLVCTKHRTLLQTSPFTPCQSTDEFHFLEKPLISSTQNTKDLNVVEMETAIQLANGIQWIFDNFDTARQLWTKYMNCYRDVYFLLLAQKGFASKHGVILKTQFTRDIVRYYGRILSFWDLTFSSYQDDYWPIRVFLTSSKEPQPIRHFLMMQYLSGSIQNFFDQLKSYEPCHYQTFPSSYYYFGTKSSLFNRDRLKFRIFWGKNCRKYFSASNSKLEQQTVSARSWLYKYDYDWLINNLATAENARTVRMLDKKNQDFIERGYSNRLPFLISETVSHRFERKRFYPFLHYEIKLFIKSIDETKAAYKKWKISYRVKKKLEIVSILETQH